MTHDPCVTQPGKFGTTPIAAKKLYSQFMSGQLGELQRELFLLSELKHPHIVTFYGSVQAATGEDGPGWRRGVTSHCHRIQCRWPLWPMEARRYPCPEHIVTFYGSVEATRGDEWARVKAEG